ncbi:uncharacterized protein [Glycine max]|uniref:uncharacterized protein n=1 Tax=Glycine max TaxID=3847 RepID=UPI0003DE9B93|nr:uncharacterized protein LOC102664618 [Glycine max]|eukprot:XP_006603312.1 uncharacterized protein LOC102664618 [Glycine max]
MAFERIKQCLMNPPMFMPPVPGRPLIRYMIVLDESMGYVLGQHDKSGKRERAIYYLSKKFIACEMNYSLLERTCCAMVWATHRLRQYMLSYITWLVSKMDPVKYIFEKPALTVRIARWQVLLSKFNIVYVTQKAIKGSALADYQAQQPINDYQPMHPEFPDEDIITLFEEEVKDEDRDKWIVWFDGASNALGHGIGAILVSPDKQYIPFTARLCFDCTKNIMDYEACALGIRAAIDFRVKSLKVYEDSTLVIHPLKGEWETKVHKLVPYQAYIRKLMKLFDDISFHHIPREENQMADALATLAPMFTVSLHEDLSYIEFKCREYLPEASDNDKRTLLRLAAGFLLSGNILYKRNHDMVLLRCVDARETEQMLVEVHEGSFGMHANGHAMARKILRAGYYWLTIENDCCVHGIDVIEAIEPKASNGHRFILVAIDYFTKWVEVASYASVTGNMMNGAIEAANKNIKKIVQKMTVSYKDWHEMPPFALHGYRTSVHTSTGATPFSLVYVMEAILLFDVEIPSLRILAESRLEEAEWVQARFDQLNRIKGKRLSHRRLYQSKVKNAFDRRVCPCKFSEGGLVLKKVS